MKTFAQLRELSNNMSYTAVKKELGVSYFGTVAGSHKIELSLENSNTLTYCLYLAPADLSGKNVCPNSKHCKEHCLNGSGQNKADQLAHGKMSNINISRIKKTRLFYSNRNLFVNALVHEIERARAKAAKLNLPFSVRLNGTSDLSPELFKVPGTDLNILQYFNGVQFYDYTKVPNRKKLVKKYDNYDLTFSFDGYNWNECENYLNAGGRVAVVFYGDLPKMYKGYKVIDGNSTDTRYLEPGGVIVGLTYHVTANDYKKINGRNVFQVPQSKFVVKTFTRDASGDIDLPF